MATEFIPAEGYHQGSNLQMQHNLLHWLMKHLKEDRLLFWPKNSLISGQGKCKPLDS